MHELRIRNLLIVVAGLYLIIVADHLGIFAGFNSYCYNLAFRLRGPEPPSANLVIAAIDDRTLSKLGRWPLERSRYAQLLKALPEARAVGFAIIMAEPTADDAFLARSAAEFGRAVLPSYVDRRHRLQLPVGDLAGIPAGHIHLEQNISGQAIGVYTSLRPSLGSPSQPAFATLVHSITTGSPGRTISAPPQPEVPVVTEEIGQKSLMRINYCGPPGTIPAVSFADILAGKFPPGAFRDRIVLVGVTAPGIGEGVVTPFTQNRDRMSAVEVQANILHSLLKQNSIRVPGEGTELLICLALSVALFLAFVLQTETSATVTWLVTSAGFAVAVATMFSQWQIWLDPALFLACAAFLYVMAILFKLDKAAGDLQEECCAITRHLDPDGLQQGKRKTLPGLAGHLSLGGINREVVIFAAASRQLIQHSREKESANRELEKKHREVTELKGALEERVVELESALARVKQLEEMIPICMYCKKIRDDRDYWERLERYFEKHAGVMFTHSVCPECYQEQVHGLAETERLEQTLSREGIGISPAPH